MSIHFRLMARCAQGARCRWVLVWLWPLKPVKEFQDVAKGSRDGTEVKSGQDADDRDDAQQFHHTHAALPVRARHSHLTNWIVPPADPHALR